MKNKSYQSQTKKRDILFKNIHEINIKGKDDISTNSANNLSKSTLAFKRFHLNKGQIPIFSKNKKIILIVENKYEKKHQKGKSPFFISDKLNFKSSFKLQKIDNKHIKQKHLGICDYYSKMKDSDNSKTPRFHKD